MTHKSSTAADARLNPSASSGQALGEMRYGEPCHPESSEGSCAGPHALTFADGDTYSYDANGNLTSKANTTYTWDHRNQLTSVEHRIGNATTVSTYLYDAEGQRTRQTVMSEGYAYLRYAKAFKVMFYSVIRYPLKRGDRSVDHVLCVRAWHAKA